MADLLPLPNLLIPGVAKSGTSSLAWYLSQHPEICPGDRKEINYFLPVRYGAPPRGTLEDYARHFAAWAGETYRMDASAGYSYGGSRLVEAVRRALPDPRIVIILRNPVDRFWSSYRSKKDRGRIPAATDFRAYFETCRRYHENGQDLLRENHRYRALGIGWYSGMLQDWIGVFGDRVHVVFFEHLVDQPARVVTDVCTNLGLDTDGVQDFDYAVRNVTVSPRSHALSALARRVNLQVDRHFRAHPGAKATLRSVYQAVNGSTRRELLEPRDRAVVEEFYAPANKELFELLTALGYRDFPPWLAEAA